MALNGIDISSYQSGINLAKVPCDFVIVKATQGTGYTSPSFIAQYNAAKAAGKKLGIYHYAAGKSAAAEAKYFLKVVGDRYKDAVLCLDWESGSNPAYGSGKNMAWVKAWMDTVEAATGRKPLLYCSPYLISYYAAYKDRIWAAQYASNNIVRGYQAKPWNEGKYSCKIRQYTGCGRLSGYANNLDLDKFYGTKADWDKMVGAKSTGASPAPTSGKLAVDGSWGVATTKAVQKFFGTTVDGIVSGQPKANKKYLPGVDGGSWKFVAYRGTGSSMVRAMQKWLKVSVDGFCGPETIKALQKKIGAYVDGELGPKTVKAFQEYLNKR